MARPRSEHPTELELAILKVLWPEKMPQSVQDVREALASAQTRRELTYSSVITVLNIMVRKKYLKRAKRSRAFFYEPIVTERQIHRGMLGDLVGRVFDGRASAVILELLDTSDIDVDELKRIRRLINRKTRENSG